MTATSSPSATSMTTGSKRGRDDEDDRDDDEHKKIDDLLLIDVKIEELSYSELRKLIKLFLKNAGTSMYLPISKMVDEDLECHL